MTFKINLVFLAIFTVINPSQASDDWGVTGHRTIGAIAQQYLDPETAAQVAELLDGASLAFVSTYADEIRSDDQYDRFDPWHYVSFPFGGDYHTHPKSDKGDIIQGIDKCKEIVRDKNKTKQERAFYLKLLVHFVGDLHQPLHVGIQEDRGGNRFYVKWFGDNTNLHSVWDTKIIEGYNMSYTELVQNQDRLTAEQIQEIQRSSVTDWMDESRALCEDVYSHTEAEEKLSYEYSYRYLHVARGRLQKGGLRLAALLNELL
jgi:hypothetical protein